VDRQRRSRPVTASVDIEGLPATSNSGQKYSANDNINVNALKHPHHHHHQQQQQQQQQKEEMRRKLAQWYHWRHRYGVLASIYITEELRRPKLPQQSASAASRNSTQPIKSGPHRNQSSIAKHKT